MAVNDLMMKIQLLVESGKSSAELKRLQQALKALQTQLTALDRTQLTPLTRDLNAVKQAASNLKTVNLSNFASQINEVKKAFTGLGLGVNQLVRLKDAYQQLSTAKAANEVGRLDKELRKANLALDGVRASAKNGILFTAKNTFFDLNQIKGYDRYVKGMIQDENNNIRNQREEIIRLKSSLRSLGSTYQNELRAAGKLDFAGLSRQLKDQKADLVLGQQGIKSYVSELRVMRNELKRIKEVGKQISAKEMINIAKALPTSDIKRLSRELDTSSGVLKVFKDNLKLIQDSNLKFRVYGFGDVRSIANVRNEIGRLKDEIKAASVIKFDPNVVASLSRMGSGLSAIRESRSFESLRQFNQELTNQQQGLLKAQNGIRFYQNSLAQLRLESRNLAIPDFTLGGTRKLVNELNLAQSAIRQLRTQELLPLQNELRNLQSAKSFQKALNISPLDAAVKRLKAEIPDLKQKLEVATFAGNLADVVKYSTQIASKKDEIIQKELRSAQLNEAMVNTLGKQIANVRSLSNEQKNRLSFLNNEEKNIRSLISAERQRAKDAAQAVKIKPDGILDVTGLKNQQSALANLYRSNVASLKQYYGELKRGAQESASALTSRLTGLNSELAAVKSLESAQKSSIARKQREAAEIQRLVTAEEERYRNLARLGQLQNQHDQKQLASRIQARDADLQTARSAVDSIRQRVSGTKEEINSIKATIREREALLKNSIAESQQKIASSQLTRQQLQEERASVRDQITAQKELSRLYQDTLKSNVDGLRLALQGEKLRIQSIKSQIKELTQLNTAEAQLRATQLRSELASVKARRGGLSTQIRDIEQAAKAEIQRIRTLEQSSNALRRHGNAISTLGRLFKEAGGPVREFSAALRFALGPQMAGFAAAGSIIGLMSGFVTANKEIENLKRGLNAITGSSELYFQELSNTANRLGQSILVVSDSYLQLVAASKGTRLEGEATRQIFESVSNALVLTGADAVRSRRAFLALAQMMSKGQIYAEELRQQLSEALPGAVNIFSRALGVAPQKLLEMMKVGEVSSDALILFMGELKKSMPPVTQEMFTFSQKAALLQNTFQRLFVEVGDTGVWNALGDSLVSANRFLSKATDGVGDFGDEVKTTYGYLSTLGELTGIGEALSGGLEGLVGFSKDVFDEFVSILEGLPAKAAEIAIRTRAALQQASAATGGESSAFNRILGEVGAFNDAIKSVYQSIFSGDFGATAIDYLSQSFDSFVSGGIENRLRNAQAELLRLQQAARLTKEQFDALGNFERPGGTASAPLKINLGDYAAYNRFIDESIAKEKQNIQELEKKRGVLKTITQERQADLSAVDEAGQTRDYLNLFNEGYRTAIKSAREAIAAAQRAAELSSKVATVQDKQAANKIQSIKKIQDLENSIYETQVRSKEITDAAVKNRLEDERSLLELTLDRENAIAQSEENAKNLRKGREDQGIYFTEDMKKASRDAQQARKLEQQAIELSERAAQSKNEVEKRGLLENSKYLQEQAAQLNQSAGETYLLKQNYEALTAIAQQLTKAGEAELKIRQDIAEAELLAEQARNAQAKAVDKNALKAERDEWSKIADERARAAAQKFSDSGLTEQAAAMGQLRLELEKIQQVGKTELEDKIVAALKQFNLQNQPDYQQVFADLGKQLNELRKAESDIVGQLQQTQSPESKTTLEERIAQIRRDFQVLNQAYQRVREQLQQAIDAGEAPGIEFPSYLESKGAVDAVPGALSTTQWVVNQSAPIVFRSVLQAPSLNSSTPEQSVPIALSFTQNPASQIVSEWQQTLQQFPTPGFLTCPVEVDTTSLISSAAQTLSEVQQLFGSTSFAFDTTQPIQSLDQLKYAFVSTQAQIVSASQSAQQNPIIPRVDATSAVSEGAKAGQAVATAANQAAAQNPVKLTTDSSNYDLFSGLDSSKLNQGIQTAMNQAQSTVKTSVAQMNQELLTKLGQREGGFQIKIETVVDQTSLEGWKRQVSLLSASDNRVSLRADTAELDQEFRRIDGQLAEWNRTAGNGLKAGFVNATQQAQNFGLLVDQVNQKMRAIQNPNALPPVKPVIEPVVETKTAYQQVQEQLNQSNPITISADAAPLVGEIQTKLNELRASGATQIQVTLDEKTGQLVITANTDPANEAVKSVIQQIEARDVVLRVRVVYSDPGYSNGSTSTEGEKKRWGGYISGYGGGDRIRALLEPGEFVLRKEAVKALGLSSLTKLNNLGFNAKIPKPSPTIDRVSIPRFANGGAVQGQPIVINIPGGKSIQVSGSRDSAMQLANLLTRVGRAV